MSLKPPQRILVTLGLLQPPLHTQLRISSFLSKWTYPGSWKPRLAASESGSADSPSGSLLVAPALSALLSPVLLQSRQFAAVSASAGAATAAPTSRPGSPAQSFPQGLSWVRGGLGFCTPRPPRPRWGSAPRAREGPRRRPACIRARGGSAPSCCRGTRSACAAGPTPGRAARRPRQRPSGSWQRPLRPRARRGCVPEQVSARRYRAWPARNEWEPGRRAAGQAGKRVLLGPVRLFPPLGLALPRVVRTGALFRFLFDAWTPCLPYFSLLDLR